VSDPNNPYGQNPGDPYGQNPQGQNPQGQGPYGQDPQGQSPYGQAPQGQSPYGQNPYGGQPAYQGGPTTPNHPQATTILVLGILSIVCCSFLGPVAWVMGSKAIKQIDASGGQYGGRDQVKVGKILGIIGTVLLVLGVLVVLGTVIFGLALGDSFSSEFDSGFSELDSDWASEFEEDLDSEFGSELEDDSF